MAVFSAYFDASGTHDDSFITVNAGFVASWGRWDKFYRKWQRVLRAPHPPHKGIGVFHANDFFPSYGEFKGWKEPEKEIFIEALIETLKGLHPITYLVKSGEFQEVKSLYTDPRIMVYTPYKLCFDHSLLSLDGWANRAPGRDEISVFFEDGPDKHNTDVFKLYEEAMRSDFLKIKHKITSIDFIKKKSDKGIPLQPADLVAWILHRCHTDGSKYPDRGIKEPLAKKTLNDIYRLGILKKGEGCLLDRPKIKEFFEKIISYDPSTVF